MRGKWTRRDFIKHAGMSAVVAPVLHFWTDLAEAAEPPKYMVLIFFPDGKTGSNTFITRNSTGWTYGRGFAPLEPFKSQTIAFEKYGFQNLAQRGTVKDGHTELCATMFTGSGGNAGDDSNAQAKSPSIDQIVAKDYLDRGIISDPLRKTLSIEMIGSSYRNTRPFVQPNPGYVLNSTDGSTPLQPVSRLQKPIDGFNRLFSGVVNQPVVSLWGRGAKVVDIVFNQAKSLRTFLPVEGQAVLDVHIQALSDLETSLIAQQTDTVLTVPTAPADIAVTAANHERLFTAWAQIIDAAFRFDRTRIVTIQCGGAASRFNVPSLNLPFVGSGDSNSGTDIHSYTHHNESGVDNYLLWFSQRTAELCTLLRGGTGKADLLPSSIVMGGWEFGHNHAGYDIPVYIIGGAGGYLNTGQAITMSSDETMASKQHVAVLKTVVNAMGTTQVTTLGHASYQIPPLAQMIK